MGTKINKKGRVLYLLEFLYKETDEKNSASTKEIIDYLGKRGISVNRKTLKDDVSILVEAGYDIVTRKSSHNSFFFRNRKFKILELKLLMDAVLSSQFITHDKSEELIEKLRSLASTKQSEQLVRHLFVADRIKTDNEQIYDIVDTITDAINKRKKIQFQYIEYTPEKKKVLKNKGELYTNNPYALLWNDDRYYLVGFSEKHNKIVQFRVDRMFKARITSSDAILAPVGFNVADYTRKVFKMFDGDESIVELECENKLMKVIIDRFGEDVDTSIATTKTFKVRTRVSISPTFYGWIFQFGGQIRIVSPLFVKERYQKMIRAARKATLF